jgi:thiamine biosynthesis lipoprotein ApbE
VRTSTVLRPGPLAGAADWTALGCQVRLVVGDPSDLPVARAVLESELEAIDRACSRFRADSELSRVNDGDGRPVPISPLFAEAVEVALDAAAATDGDVDPTVGTAMEAIGYDRDYSSLVSTATGVTAQAVPAPGRAAVRLDRAAMTVTVPVGVHLDLGATAKAFVVDRAARRIEQTIDGRSALVAVGGDLATSGSAPPGGWSVRAQDATGPVDSTPQGPHQLVTLVGGALATSSTTARRWLRGDQLMHHIVNPRDGNPAASPWRTVTVAAPTCVQANVASTASIVRGVPAVGWLRRLGLPARFVDNTGRVITVGGWPQPEGVAP